MRTSLRVFVATLSTVLVAAMVILVPAPQATALNGVHTISVSGRTCAEQTATCQVTVTVQPTPSVPSDNISATIKSTDDSARAGSDYTAVNQTVSWAYGDPTSKTINVGITDDAFREPNETFVLSVVNPVSASAGPSGVITIADNEGGNVPTLTVAATPPSAAEGNADNVRVVTVTMSNATGQSASVNYATSDGSATSDTAKGAVDYAKIATQTLTWGPNENSAKQIPITIKGDTTPEPDERFFVNFGSANNALIAGTNPASVDLLNDDGQASDIPKLTIEPIPDKTEGDTSSTTQTVTVTLAPAASQTVTVDYATSNGTAVASTADAKGDYETTKGTLTFPQGTTSKTFTVPVVGDPAAEADEIYHVTLTNPSNAQLATASRDAKILNDDFGQVTTAPGAGGGPHVRLFGATGSDLGGFFAYEPVLTSGVHVARGDFFTPTQNGFVVGADGIDEIITGPGAFPASSSLKSRPVVRIFAIDGTQLASFFAFDTNYAGGVYVSAGNLDGDAANGDELVVGAGPGGGPHVKVFRIKGPGDNIGVLASFFAYTPGFGGGVRVAVGDMGGDAKDELVTAAGPGGGPHIIVWRPNADGTATAVSGFMAYGAEFTGGVFIAAAKNRIVTGPGAGGGPHVRAFDGAGTPQGGGFMAYEPNFTGGVTVGAGNLDNDVAAEIVTGAGPGGGPHVKIFRPDGTMPFGGGFFAYDPNFHGGVEVAISVAG
ncbi:MAG TPA: Calx-beta domain-containing protein [Acidimicrobiales bacterium]|nr:Calx-beta domain-containing protein [Acidimicrobiales bacterium]